VTTMKLFLTVTAAIIVAVIILNASLAGLVVIAAVAGVAALAYYPARGEYGR
jgi:hypothetical protein